MTWRLHILRHALFRIFTRVSKTTDGFTAALVKFALLNANGRCACHSCFVPAKDGLESSEAALNAVMRFAGR